MQGEGFCRFGKPKGPAEPYTVRLQSAQAVDKILQKSIVGLIPKSNYFTGAMPAGERCRAPACRRASPARRRRKIRSGRRLLTILWINRVQGARIATVQAAAATTRLRPDRLAS